MTLLNWLLKKFAQYENLSFTRIDSTTNAKLKFSLKPIFFDIIIVLYRDPQKKSNTYIFIDLKFN